MFAMDDTAAPTDAVQLASSMDKACFSIVYRFYSFAHECVETDGAKHNSRLLQVLPGTPQHEAFETPQCRFCLEEGSAEAWSSYPPRGV